MPPPSIPGGWTAEKELEVLLGVIKFNFATSKPGHWKEIAAIIGEGVSPSAVQQRYSKMLKEFGGDSSGAAKKSPAKSTPKKVSKSKATSKRKTKDIEENEGEQEADNSDQGNDEPTHKKVKTEAKQDQDDDEEEDDGLLV